MMNREGPNRATALSLSTMGRRCGSIEGSNRFEPDTTCFGWPGGLGYLLAVMGRAGRRVPAVRIVIILEAGHAGSFVRTFGQIVVRVLLGVDLRPVMKGTTSSSTPLSPVARTYSQAASGSQR